MKIALVAVAVLGACGVGLYFVMREQAETRVYLPPRELSADEKKLVKNNNKFAWDFFRQVSQEHAGNLVVSPFSVSTAFAMIYAGARDATEKEMARVFYFEGEGEKLHSGFAGLAEINQEKHLPPGTLWNSANRLWIHRELTLEQPFQDLLRQNYDLGFEQVDFVGATDEARDRINEWVSEQTAGKIERILQTGDLDAETRLVMANAIYFKSEWEQKFEKSETQDGKFHLTYEKMVSVPFMHLNTEKSGADFRYWIDDTLEVLEIPYKNNRFAMVILLPRKIDGLDAMMKDLSSNRIENIISGLHNSRMNLVIPKLKISSRMQLKDTLFAMGLKDLYSLQRSNLKGITEEPLFLSQTWHQTIIEVNEEGTEVVAVTVHEAVKNGGPSDFRVDHPFLFLIRDKHTGGILFMGRVVDPSQTE